MKNAVIAALTLLAVGLSMGAQPAAAETSDETAIKDIFRQISTLSAAHQVDAAAALYSPDVFVFDVLPPRQHVGAEFKSELREAFTVFDKTFVIDVSDLNISVHGDVAFTRSIQHISATGSSGKSMDFVCRVTDVLEKRDGRWVIVQEHSSVPVDVFGAGKADLLSRP